MLYASKQSIMTVFRELQSARDAEPTGISIAPPRRTNDLISCMRAARTQSPVTLLRRQ